MRFLTVLLILVLSTGTALAQDSPAKPDFEQKTVQTPVDKSAADIAGDAQAAQAQWELRRAMNDEIAIRNAATQDRVAALVIRLETAGSSEDRLAVQRLVSEAKHKGWRDVLAIQLKYAERGGHAVQAEELRERITRLDEEPVRNPIVPTTSHAKSSSGRRQGGAK